MTRYRKTPLTTKQLKEVDTPEITIEGLGGRKKQINYIWMPDKDGTLIKKDSSIVKKSFVNLSSEAQVALTEYIIRVQNRVPTDAARKVLFNSIVDGAVAAYKEGKKQSPWSILETLIKNAPDINSQSISYTQYDDIAASALINQVAKSIGYDTSLLSPEDRADFLTKINQAAQAADKQITRKATAGGMETVTIPGTFNGKDFANNYLWTKVNLADPKTIPTSVINQVDTIRTLLKNNGIQLSDREINKIGLDLSSKAKDINTVQKELTDIAAKDYPQLAPRLMATPGLTVREALSPLIKTIANTWEVDPDTIDITDPMIDQFIRPDGVLGKQPPKSNYDVYQWAVSQPRYEQTIAANTDARAAANSLGRAMGWGV